jgi:hypothetical protein
MTGLVGALMAAPLILLSIELAQTRGWGLLNALELPAVFRLTDRGARICVDAATLKACTKMPDFMALILDRCIDGRTSD